MLKKYPMKLSPYCKGVIWGGSTLKNEFGKISDIEKLGETWELSVFPGKESVISNGEYTGMKLSEYLSEDSSSFPILVKFIDAAANLSIQVHPEKNEMWYIVKAEEGAKIVYGLNGIFSTLKTANAITAGTLENYLNYVEVHRGDVFYIPTGLVHAIGKGIIIAEIQQTNDITYRLYDYNRVDKDGKKRPLHVTQALHTIKDFTEDQIGSLRFSRDRSCSMDTEIIASCDYFTVSRYEISGEREFSAVDFIHLLCLDGHGDIDGVEINKGDSIFIPSGYGKSTVFAKDKIELIASQR